MVAMVVVVVVEAAVKLVAANTLYRVRAGVFWPRVTR